MLPVVPVSRFRMPLGASVLREQPEVSVPRSRAPPVPLGASGHQRWVPLVASAKRNPARLGQLGPRVLPAAWEH